MRYIGFAFLYVTIALALCACSFETEVHGTVRDEHGQPVKGAKVILMYGEYVSESQTDVQGLFSVRQSHLRGQDLLLLVSKDGNRLFAQSIDSEKGSVEVAIVLKGGSQMEIDTPVIRSFVPSSASSVVGCP